MKNHKETKTLIEEEMMKDNRDHAMAVRSAYENKNYVISCTSVVRR